MQTPRPKSLRKRVVFSAVTLIAVATVVEGISYVGLVILQPNGASFAKMRDDRAAIAAGGLRDIGDIGQIPQNVVVHPYLGWVLDPKEHPKQTFAEQPFQVNEFGFLDVKGKSLLHERSENKVIVGVVGGSVAFGLSVLAAETLIDGLQSSARFRDKEVVIVRLAIPAYKQPQQLFALTYALILGAEFDIVINIDGYNEVALHAAENALKSVFVTYPRGWNFLAIKVDDPEIEDTEQRVRRTDKSRKFWAMTINAAPLCYSPTANLIWRWRDHELQKSRNRDFQTIITHQSSTKPSYTAAGPTRSYDSDADMYRDIAKIWANSSQKLDQLCRANGMEYYHILQPNQYLPGSKPLSEDEQKQAIYPGPDYKHGEAIKQGYPFLIKEGARLKSRGLNFSDLTGLFSETRETIYIDTCCHYNQRGNEMLMKSIADSIASADLP